MQSSSKPTSGAPAVDRPTLTRQHFQQKYFELRELAEGGNSTLYLVVSKAEVQAIRAQSDNQKQIEAAIRQKIAVIKVARSGYSSLTQAIDDLRSEINVLTTTVLEKHPQIVEVIDYHDDQEHDIVWLAMPYLCGRAVGQVRLDYPEALSKNLIWHITYQVLGALKFLTFGIKGTSNTKFAPSHGDLHDFNVLFTPGKPIALPDIKLIDFGQSTPRKESDCDYQNVFGDLYMLSEMVGELMAASKSPDMAGGDSQMYELIDQLSSVCWPPELDLRTYEDKLEELFDTLLASALAGRELANRVLPPSSLVAKMFDDVRVRLSLDRILSSPNSVDESHTSLPNL